MGSPSAHAGTNEEGRDVFRDATLAFGLAYERAIVAWFDSLPAELTGSGASGEGRGP